MNEKKIFFIFFTSIVIFKIFLIFSIHHKRYLPIEVDDAFVYLGQSKIFYKDIKRESNTQKSLKNFIATYKELDINYEKSNISRYERMNTNRYSSYAMTIGFFTKVLNLDEIKVWWFINYFSQILILASSFLFFFIYYKSNKIIDFILYGTITSFSFLVMQHQITATPFILGFNILLIFYLLKKFINSKELIFLSYCITTYIIFFHPILIIIYSFLVLNDMSLQFVASKKTDYLEIAKNNIGPIVIIFFCILYEIINMTIFNLNFKIGLFEKFSDKEYNKFIFDAINYNFFPTIIFLSKIIQQTLPFGKIISLIIYLIIFITLFFQNKKIFVLNFIFIFLLLLIGLIHFEHHHPGAIILYTGNLMIMVTAINFIYILKKITNLKYKYFTIIIIIFFLINNISPTKQIIEKRTKKDNLENIIPQLKSITENFKKEEYVVFSDDRLLTIFLNNNYDSKILLSDNLTHFKGKKERKYNIKHYLSQNKNDNSVFIFGIKYFFSNKKEFKNFTYYYN